MKETLTCMICHEMLSISKITCGAHLPWRAMPGSVATCRVTSPGKRGAGNFLLLFYLSNLLHRTSDELHQIGLHLDQAC